MNYLIILIKFKVSRFLCRSVYNEGYTFSFFQWLKKKTPAKRFEPGASSVRPGTPARETRRNLPFFFVNLRTFRRFLSGWWYGQSGQPPWFFFLFKKTSHLWRPLLVRFKNPSESFSFNGSLKCKFNHSNN
jgi:hypothetical protein